jgi:hypothetical protein
MWVCPSARKLNYLAESSFAHYEGLHRFAVAAIVPPRAKSALQLTPRFQRGDGESG